MRHSRAVSAAIAAAYAPATLAATASFCPEDQTSVCYQWGVPEAAASSGSGNIYFQLRAPTSVQWAGLGIGSQMAGAQMFVMYQDGKGNVTLSTRKGVGHVMPQFVERSDVELLAGSGVVDGNMIANVRCSKCTGLDLSGSTGWLGAWKNGDPLDSTSTSATITQHDIHSTFNVDLSKASISSDSNPFSSSSGSGNSGNSGSGSSGGSSGDNSGAVTQGSNPNETLIYAHGILMSVVMLAGFPLGSILMPLIGNWMIHAGWQMIAFLGMWAGLGIGYILSRRLDIFFAQAHTRLGIFVVSFMGIQPVLGFLHHRYYVAHKKRGIISHIHIWWGRSLMILGMVNGGLGLQLANGSRRFIIAYCVVAGLVAALYLASIAFGVMRRRRPSSKGAGSP